MTNPKDKGMNKYKPEEPSVETKIEEHLLWILFDYRSEMNNYLQNVSSGFGKPVRDKCSEIDKKYTDQITDVFSTQQAQMREEHKQFIRELPEIIEYMKDSDRNWEAMEGQVLKAETAWVNYYEKRLAQMTEII